MGHAVCEPGPGLGVRSGGLRLRDGAWAEVVDLVALAQSGCFPAACVVFSVTLSSAEMKAKQKARTIFFFFKMT